MQRDRVLITGGCGYLGSVLAIHLRMIGYKVTVVDNLIYGQKYVADRLSQEGIEVVNADVRYLYPLRFYLVRSDVVVPMAALVGAPVCERKPRLAEEVNVRAVNDLHSLLSSTQKVVFPTTNSGYGTQKSEALCTETTPLEPISLYGQQKKRAEEIVLSHPNATSLRLATVFGDSLRLRLDLMVNDFAWKALTEHKITVFDPQFRRNFIHVADVANAFSFVIQRDLTGVYNVGNDSLNTTKGELAKKICNWFGAEYCEGQGFDPDRRDYVVSSEKITKAGFRCLNDLYQGLEEIRVAHELYQIHRPKEWLKTTRNVW